MCFLHGSVLHLWDPQWFNITRKITISLISILYLCNLTGRCKKSFCFLKKQKFLNTFKHHTPWAHSPPAVSGISLPMDTPGCWGLAVPPSPADAGQTQALLWLQAGACSRGHCESTGAAACTERAGRGARTSIPTQGTMCHSYWYCSRFPCWKGDGCSSEQVPRSQAVSSHHA